MLESARGNHLLDPFKLIWKIVYSLPFPLPFSNHSGFFCQRLSLKKESSRRPNGVYDSSQICFQIGTEIRNIHFQRYVNFNIEKTEHGGVWVVKIRN